MLPVSLGVLCSFLIVINGYRIHEPAPMLEIVAPKFPLEEENLAIVFDNFTITGNCPCLDGEYTCWLFYLELNDVVPPGCFSPYDVHVVDGPPVKPPNQTNNLLGLGIEMTSLVPAEKDPDCWLVPLDSGRAPDCTFSRPKVNDSLMIFNDIKLRDGAVKLYRPYGGSFYNGLGFLGGQNPVGVPDSSASNETITIKDVDVDVDFLQLGSDLNETFPIPNLEIAFTKGFKPTIFNNTHVIALPNIKPTTQYNKYLPRFSKPTESKLHYVQAIDVLHPVQTQDRMQNQHQIKTANRIPTSGNILFKESTNKNKLAMAMVSPQTTQPPPPPSTPSSSRPTGGKKRKKTTITATTSTSTVSPTSTTKMGQRKMKFTKTTTASTTSSTSVFTSRKKIKRTRTTVSADS